MALTVCGSCDKCYSESLPACNKCGKTLQQQIDDCYAKEAALIREKEAELRGFKRGIKEGAKIGVDASASVYERIIRRLTWW